MFHPPQAAIGLALLPLVWASAERARAERGGMAAQERDRDLARYFPPAWNRETVPDWFASPAGRSSWSGLLRSAVRRVKGLVPGLLRRLASSRMQR